MLRRRHAVIVPALLLAALATSPARAQPGGVPAPAEAAADALPVWERSLYKTLTYQAAANLSDLALYDVVLGGTAAACAGFFAVNAASAAALYFGFEYAWQTLGSAPPETSHGAILEKTVYYRLLNSSRNFALGYAFSGSTAVAAGFVAANVVTDTAIFVANEYGWDAFRPVPPAP